MARPAHGGGRIDRHDLADDQPIEEFDGDARIRATRVRVTDIGGEEFKEAIGGALADGGDEGRGAVGEDDKLGHNRRPASKSSKICKNSARVRTVSDGGRTSCNFPALSRMR